MTRRERIEARLSRRREWALGREKKSSEAFATARRIADGIPFGQPILVGHHSEKHARRDAARIYNGMSKGCEHADMAKHHDSRADGIERQLATSIYSDDSNAIEALRAKAAKLTAKRDAMKAANSAYRKGDAAFAAALGITVEAAAARRIEIEKGYSWNRKPFPSYALTNLGATIRGCAKRITEIDRQAAETVAAEAAGGVLITRSSDGEYCSVRFSDKPDREILDALRGAGFHWGGGAWSGHTSKLPNGIVPSEVSA